MISAVQKPFLKASKLIFLTCCLLASHFIYAQESADPNLDQAKSLVDFYRYMLNTVGAKSTSTRDKEVIITESFKKVFKDNQVQIEDDLLPDRNAITNKNVQAYLRDVDFFFTDISFEFQDMEVEKSTRDNGKDFYLVSFNNIIKATTIEGDPYNSSQKRYVEINLQEAESDLKIVSVYSTKISRERELRNWWRSLSYEWSKIFSGYVKGDSASNSELLKIAAIDSLNLSGNRFLLNIKPLSALTNLKYLNISDTRIDNIEPIRFALQLETLVANNCRVSDIGLLQYLENIKKLDLSNTPVMDVSAVGRLKKLEQLNLSSISGTVFDALQHIKTLKSVNLSNTSFSYPALLTGNKELSSLDLSRTGVGNIDYLSELTKIETLDLSETYINSLKPLKDIKSLKTLRINQTQVFDLAPLASMPNLERVYCDNTGVTEKQTLDFMAANKRVLVISNTQKVLDWWKGLNDSWKRALQPYVLVANPEKEDIIRMINVDSLDLSGKRLVDTEPLKNFKNVQKLNLNGNLFTDLQFAGSLEYLTEIQIQNLPIDKLKGLENCKNLEKINARGTLVSNLTAINDLNKLVLVDVDDTPILESSVRQFLKFSPKVVVIYQTKFLDEWWDDLLPEWKEVFGLNDPSPFELHQLAESTSVNIENTPISSLGALDVFVQLKKITISNAQVTSLIDLATHEELEEVVCKNGPLFNLDGIDRLQTLKSLDISNTAIDDLRPLRPLLTLEKLDASGTNMKRIKGLEELLNLKYLNISNTRVWQLDRLYDIRSLQTLVCYNTRIRDREIEDFKEVFPECNVNFY